MIVKRDGRRQPFDRAKVRAGVLSACRKRPISMDTIEKLVSDVESSLQEFGSEVPSTLLGDSIIKRLKVLDDVAYVRFASVYKQFDQLDTFLDEIKQLRTEESC
jgi:transcriptional repressor NrdR